MTVDMTRHSGDISIPVVECTDSRLQKYRIRTDILPEYDEESGEQKGVSFVETEYPYKPSLEEVKDYVYAVIDAETDEKILTGYVWTVPKVGGEPEQMSVWLSTENQFNYKAAFDLAMQTGGQNLPAVFKFGTMDNPVYHTFTELSELQDFYIGAVMYINNTLAEGWQKKDNFDFTPYEVILNPVVENQEESES